MLLGRQLAHIDHRHLAYAARTQVVHPTAIDMSAHAQGHLGDARIQHGQQRLQWHLGLRQHLDKILSRHPAGLVPDHSVALINTSGKQHWGGAAPGEVIDQIVPGIAAGFTHAWQVMNPDHRAGQAAWVEHLALPVLDVVQDLRSPELRLFPMTGHNIVVHRRVRR